MGRQPWDDYWKRFKKQGGFRFKRPEVNRWVLISILLTLAVATLAYLHVKTGSYLKILEENKTELLSSLTLCYSEKESLSSDLKACNSSLKSKSLMLTKCQREKDELDNSLDECKDDLDTCKSDYKLIKVSYEKCRDDLDEFGDFLADNNLDDVYELRDKWDDMKSDLNKCQSDYNTLSKNYAKDYCCLLNDTWGNITSYKISNNKVLCTNSTSDTYLAC